jgi:hypothetical protein
LSFLLPAVAAAFQIAVTLTNWVAVGIACPWGAPELGCF